MKEMTRKSVRKFTREPGKELELVLECSEKGSRFLWLENGEPAQNQFSLFAEYNPRLLKIVEILAGIRLRYLMRADLIGILKHKRPNIYHYFLHKRPDLMGEKVKIREKPPLYGYRIPMWCVFEVLADFVPIIEKWEQADVVAKTVELTPSAIRQRHSSNTIESRKFLGRLWISPVGVQQLRKAIRSKAGNFGFGYDTYYHPADIAREVVNRRGQRGDGDRRLFIRARNRYSILIRAHRKSFEVIRVGNRDAVKKSIRDMLCDAIQKSEAARELGITIRALEALINKDSLRCYYIGSRQWVSLASCREYMNRETSRL